MNHSDQQDHLRMIATPPISSTEKGRIDVQRQASGGSQGKDAMAAAIVKIFAESLTKEILELFTEWSRRESLVRRGHLSFENLSEGPRAPEDERHNV